MREKTVYYEIPLRETATSIWASGKVLILLNKTNKNEIE
jgi:hypothetical protein